MQTNKSEKDFNLENQTNEIKFIKVDVESINEFKEFMKKQDAFLETGLGAFHTDNHSNW